MFGIWGIGIREYGVECILLAQQILIQGSGLGPGTKPGNKLGTRPGNKLGTKPGNKLGTRPGTKRSSSASFSRSRSWCYRGSCLVPGFGFCFGVPVSVSGFRFQVDGRGSVPRVRPSQSADPGVPDFGYQVSSFLFGFFVSFICVRFRGLGVGGRDQLLERVLLAQQILMF
jgi:hypothetical protein